MSWIEWAGMLALLHFGLLLLYALHRAMVYLRWVQAC